MKKSLVAFVILASLALVGCGQTPMTDADMAAQYGLSIEAFQEQKEAAARMNMSIEEHLNMGGDQSSMNHGGDERSESEVKSHQQAAVDMGMTLEEHEAAGHVGH